LRRPTVGSTSDDAYDAVVDGEKEAITKSTSEFITKPPPE